MGPIEKCLRDAREKIRKPENWTKGATAKLSDGTKTSINDPDAVSWCAMGATGTGPSSLGADNIVVDVVGGATSTWNDAPERTHEHVLAAFGLAIGVAKRKGL